VKDFINMSVDTATSSPNIPARFLQGSVRDVFILIGGWASEEAFESSPAPTMPPTPTYSLTADLLKRVLSNELTLPSGHEKRVIGLKGRISHGK
jgi:hypothetical protein